MSDMLALTSVLLAVPAWFHARRVMDRQVRRWMGIHGTALQPDFRLSISLALPRVLVIGKTGILTAGTPKVAGYVHQSRTESEDRIMALAAALERDQPHPVAQEIVRYAGERELPEISSRKADPGEGVSGLLDGKPVAIGSREYVTGKFGIDRSHLLRVIGGHTYATRVYVAMAGKLAGIFYLDDPLRPEAGRSVARLRRLGIEPVLVTGDNEQAARKAAAAAGIETVFHSLDPAGKQAAILELYAAHTYVSRADMTGGSGEDREKDLALTGDLDQLAGLFGRLRFSAHLLLLGYLFTTVSIAGAFWLAERSLGGWMAAMGMAFLWPYLTAPALGCYRPDTDAVAVPLEKEQASEGIADIPVLTGSIANGERLKDILTAEAGILGYEDEPGRLRVRYDRMKTNDRRIAELLRGAGLTDVDCGPDLPGNYSGPPLRKR